MNNPSEDKAYLRQQILGNAQLIWQERYKTHCLSGKTYDAFNIATMWTGEVTAVGQRTRAVLYMHGEPDHGATRKGVSVLADSEQLALRELLDKLARNLCMQGFESLFGDYGTLAVDNVAGGDGGA